MATIKIDQNKVIKTTPIVMVENVFGAKKTTKIQKPKSIEYYNCPKMDLESLLVLSVSANIVLIIYTTVSWLQ